MHDPPGPVPSSDGQEHVGPVGASVVTEVQALMDGFVESQIAQLEEHRRRVGEALAQGQLQQQPVTLLPARRRCRGNKMGAPKVAKFISDAEDVGEEMTLSNGQHHDTATSSFGRTAELMRRQTQEYSKKFSTESKKNGAWDESLHQEYANLLMQMDRDMVWEHIFRMMHMEFMFNKVQAAVQRQYLPARISSGARWILGNSAFTYVLVVAILTNASFIAVIADTNTKKSVEAYRESMSCSQRPCPVAEDFDAVPTWMMIIDIGYAILFSLELFTRFCAYELSFLFGADWKWNLIDLVSTLTSWLEILWDSRRGEVEDMSHIRLLRILRAFRAVRVIRVMRVFKELSLIVVSVMNAVMPLLWSLVALLLQLFIFGILFQQGVNAKVQQAAVDGGDDLIEETIPRFRSFDATMVTLFMCITGGQDWGETYFMLRAVSSLYGITFLSFIAIMHFGMLNVITGIFIECTLAKARSDREFAIMEETERRCTVMRNLLELFEKVNASRNGRVTAEEWATFAAHPDSRAVLEVVGISPDGCDIFDEGKESYSAEEFVLSCMHCLRGTGSIIEMETELRGVRKMLFESVESILEGQLRIEESLTEANISPGFPASRTASRGMLITSPISPWPAPAPQMKVAQQVQPALATASSSNASVVAQQGQPVLTTTSSTNGSVVGATTVALSSTVSINATEGASRPALTPTRPDSPPRPDKVPPLPLPLQGPRGQVGGQWAIKEAVKGRHGCAVDSTVAV